jgi:hypothetical protein
LKLNEENQRGQAHLPDNELNRGHWISYRRDREGSLALRVISCDFVDRP